MNLACVADDNDLFYVFTNVQKAGHDERQTDYASVKKNLARMKDKTDSRRLAKRMSSARPLKIPTSQ